VIGSGAQLLGPIRVGDGSRIGANAVVVRDVSAGATMVGVPAREVQPKISQLTMGPPAAFAEPARPDEQLNREIENIKARIARLEKQGQRSEPSYNWGGGHDVKH
ncbi:MAG: serine acetyltransferase, partial [Alphaproteobacteria bacterium]|nr:serine acetyltransferase [Alphaproteobacteria bacterium]